MGFCYKWNSLHLHFNKDKVIVGKCCLKSWEQFSSIKEYTLSEFLNLPNVYDELDSLKNYFPPNFPTSIRTICPPSVDACDWRDYECKLKSIEVALDAHCNAKCRFCGLEDAVNKDMKELGIWEKTKEIYFKTLYELKGRGLDIIRLTDTGEPFYWKNETINFIKSLTLADTKEVHFNSNFFSLNYDEVKQLFESSKVKIFPIVSLNAWDEDSYKELMGVNKELFYKVVRNIEYLAESGNDYQVSFVIDRIENVKYVYNFIKSRPDIFKRIIVNAANSNPVIEKEINNYFDRTETGTKLKESE